MKQMIKDTPILGPLVVRMYRKWINPPKKIESSEAYWIDRYESGDNSGSGSYRQLAEFKATIINDFVRKEGVRTVIEYGSGDGNQLSLAKYPSYIGFDISPRAIAICEAAFRSDPSKSFREMKTYSGERADMTMSLDVIHHLVEDDVFDEYMHRLFDSSDRFVVIYSSNTDENNPLQGTHVRHRKFLPWIEESKPNWTLLKHIPNKYPFEGNQQTGSRSDFFIFAREPLSAGSAD